MLNQLKTFVRRVDFFLRDEPYRQPTEDDVVLHSIDELFEDKDDPWYTRAYWTIRRFWANHWLCNPGDVCRKVKWAYQRVARGWDDTAVWSIDWWLDNKMPDMLRQLKRDKHGIPMDMFDGLPTNAEGWHDEPETDIAQARWDAIIDKMIAAFEASRRICSGVYEEELGEYPLRRPKGVSRNAWEKARADRFVASQLLIERDKKIFEEGMALFVEHYRSLWD